MHKYNIPIFVPHKGCPFDCVFCNQKRITGSLTEVTPDDVTRTIEKYLSTIPANDRNIEVAFFGGSFTGIPVNEQIALMSRVTPYIEKGIINGIRVSTRPDYINRDILDTLKSYSVKTIELGVQSMVESVLKKSNRGHSADDVKNAAALIREYGFTLGLQMMTGLPGDTDELSVITANEIIALKPDIVRIYPTLTIKDTFLEKMYHRGEYIPETLDDAVSLCKKLLLMFEENNINVIRIGLQPTDEINSDASVVAGPFHPSFRELVESSIYFDIILNKSDGKDGIIYVNPCEVSKAVGNNRANITKLKEKYSIDIAVKGDINLEKREVRFECC